MCRTDFISDKLSKLSGLGATLHFVCPSFTSRMLFRVCLSLFGQLLHAYLIGPDVVEKCAAMRTIACTAERSEFRPPCKRPRTIAVCASAAQATNTPHKSPHLTEIRRRAPKHPLGARPRKTRHGDTPHSLGDAVAAPRQRQR